MLPILPSAFFAVLEFLINIGMDSALMELNDLRGKRSLKS